MCRAGGRRCPGQYDPAKAAARNAKRRAQYAASKAAKTDQTPGANSTNKQEAQTPQKVTDPGVKLTGKKLQDEEFKRRIAMGRAESEAHLAHARGDEDEAARLDAEAAKARLDHARVNYKAADEKLAKVEARQKEIDEQLSNLSEPREPGIHADQIEAIELQRESLSNYREMIDLRDEKYAAQVDLVDAGELDASELGSDVDAAANTESSQSAARHRLNDALAATDRSFYSGHKYSEQERFDDVVKAKQADDAVKATGADGLSAENAVVLEEHARAIAKDKALEVEEAKGNVEYNEQALEDAKMHPRATKASIAKAERELESSKKEYEAALASKEKIDSTIEENWGTANNDTPAKDEPQAKPSYVSGEKVKTSAPESSSNGYEYKNAVPEPGEMRRTFPTGVKFQDAVAPGDYVRHLDDYVKVDSYSETDSGITINEGQETEMFIPRNDLYDSGKVLLRSRPGTNDGADYNEDDHFDEPELRAERDGVVYVDHADDDFDGFPYGADEEDLPYEDYDFPEVDMDDLGDPYGDRDYGDEVSDY